MGLMQERKFNAAILYLERMKKLRAGDFIVTSALLQSYIGTNQCQRARELYGEALSAASNPQESDTLKSLNLRISQACPE